MSGSALLSACRIKTVSGSIFEVPGVLVHQTNCTSRGSAGLAARVFAKYPCTDTYKDWHTQRKYGSCDVFDVRAYQTQVDYVVNMNAQWYAGKPRTGEDYTMRLNKFAKCLDQLSALVEKYQWARVNFPYRIGCGLAHGNWDTYLGMIQHFAVNTTADVYIIIPLE